MNISAPFIARPVATTLMTVGLALAGTLAFQLLPIAPLPQVDIPTIAVSASLPGASPDTMAATVATPLERALGSIAGVNEITSRSSLGSTGITLQFDLKRDINGAARDVQAAINAARTLLPTGMPSNPSYRKVNPADAPIMILALTSSTLTRGQMVDAASTVLAQRLSQVQGVGQVTVGGGALPAVRVELDPDKLAAKGIALDVVRTAITSTNVNRPKGSVETGNEDGGGRSWQIGANDQAVTAAEYAPVLLSYQNGAAVRLRDVASVVDSVQDLRNYGAANGRPAIALFVQKEPGANIIETVARVREILPRLQASISPAIDVKVLSDRTTTIRASLHEVERSMAIAVGLVILVVLLFLRSWRATLIPAVAVPVSLAGTCGVMFLCGFSLDNLSAMALTVATGFVVDDAIVVLENITRYIEQGMNPREAALKGAREIGFTVVSISLSLIAVFIPLLLMGGVVGRLFREFAVVLSAAILVSMVVSLTTTPMMAATLLRHRPAKRVPGELGQLGLWSARAARGVARGYRRSLMWTLRHQPVAVVALLAVVGLNVYLYTVIPKTFFPQQDTGVLTGSVQADQGSSFQMMQARVDKFMGIVMADPAVANVSGSTGGGGGPGGGGGRNNASFYITLKPLAERGLSADAVVARLRAKLAHEPGANLFFVPVQDIRIGGRQSNSQYQYTLQADDVDALRDWEPRVRNALSQLPELADVSTDQQDKGLQTSLVIDRDAAARLGVTVANLDTTLNDAFGQRQVGVIYNALNQYRVVMELAPQFLQSPQTLQRLYVTSRSGAQVPVSAFARVETTNTPLAVNHQSGSPASTISFNLPLGVSLSDATAAINGAMAELGVPVSVRGSFAGTANAFQQSLASQPLLIGAAVVTIYLVLGMLYESLIHPVTILSTLPSAGVGALLALMLFKSEFSIIALIGVILLIGIVKKNAIMMIDFAISRQRAGSSSAGACIYRAANLRLRPILMTTFAAIFGAVPLAVPSIFGSGVGAELRQPLGIAIVGGLILSQLLTLYTTPVVFVLMDRLSARRWRQRRARRAGLLCIGVPLLLAGCASTRVEPPAPVTAAAAYKEAGGLQGEWLRAPVAEPVPDAWWTLFKDPVLDDLQQRLVIGNETLKSSLAAVAGARAAYEASRSAMQPTLSAGLVATRSASPTATTPASSVNPSNSLSLSATANWEVDLWGRLSQASTGAQAAYQASSDDLAAARLSAQALLVQTYFSLRTADAQLALLERSVAAYQRSLDLTQARYDGGVATRSDVLQALTQLKSAQAQAADLTAQRAQLEHAIAVLLGVAPSALGLERTAALPALPGVPAMLPSTLLERRPDIAAAQRRVAAAYAQIGVADTAFFPALTLSASTGYRGATLPRLLSAPNLLWSLGSSLTEAVLDAGQRRQASAQARAAAEQATASYRQTVLTALQEVEDNLVLAAQLQREGLFQQAALEAAQHNLEITLDQYRAGTVSYLNVVSAQTVALNSESTLLGVHNRQLAAVNQLLKNIAGRWERV